MDRYLTIVLIFLLAGIGIAIAKQQWPLFYAMIGGTIIVIIYNARQNRKKHDQQRDRKKK